MRIHHRVFKDSKRFIAICVGLAWGYWGVAQAQIASVTPRQNEINAAFNSTIEVVFAQPMDASTLNTTTWRVQGSQTGSYSGTVQYDASTRTGRFIPSSFFKEGEVISVTLTANIFTQSGQPLTPAFQWQFTVAVEFGTGIFADRIELPLGAGDLAPTAILAADFNADLFPDLAVVNNTANSVTILLNNFFVPGRSFVLHDSIAVGAGANAITGSDFDGDGFMDLAVSNFDDDTIIILRNGGDGFFTVVQTITTDEHPTRLEARDFNNDGFADIAATILGINRLQLFINQGTGTFSAASQIYLTGATPYGLTTGDFDNDGDADIVVSNSGDNTILVYRNNGRAEFIQSGDITVPDFPTIIKSNDIVRRSLGEYGDGFLDLAIIHPSINSVTVLENRSRDGGFVITDQLPLGERPSDIFIADVDTADATAFTSGFGKDHDLDLAVPNFLTNNLNILRNEFNNGFSIDPTDVFASGETPSGIAGADFDKDGDIDLAVTNAAPNTISILLNQGGQSGGIRFSLPQEVIDFGQVYVGTDSTRTFTLINPTNEIIQIDDMFTSLPVFALSDSQATVGPGEIFNLAITFSPTDTIEYIDSLTVRSTAFGLQQQLTVGLHGEGIQAIISVVPDTLDFGNILPPQTATLPLQIINSGNGALLVSRLQFTDPAFSSGANQLTVPPHSNQSIDVTFTPVLPTAYVDTLTIFNNDSLNAEAPVILLGGPNQFPPRITSADTVIAIEDSLFQYTAAASDSDGTVPRFVFRDLPGWMSPSSNDPANASVEGTPREGDLDTTFVVIANDGFFADTLQVYVRVIPVNDPPVLAPIADQTTTENQLLTFNISATDPEDSTLVFSARNLPTGALLTNNGNQTATFSWIPPLGSRGDYFVTFIVSEVFEQPPLSDSAVVKISVLDALPDLVVSSLALNNTNIALNQTRRITGVARSNAATANGAFRLTFYHDGVMEADTVIVGLGVNQEVSFAYTATFNRLGAHEIRFEIDRDNQITETDENNNTAILRLQVTAAELVVRPNPFTPNEDGYNDQAVFDFSKLVLTQPQLKIFNFNGALLRTLTENRNRAFQWDGRDNNGKEQKPGVYLYVLSDNSVRVGSGYIVLAR